MVEACSVGGAVDDTVVSLVRGLTSIAGKVGVVSGATLGDDTWDGNVSLHWPNRSRRLVIVSSWSFQVTERASVTAHVSMDMA